MAVRDTSGEPGSWPPAPGGHSGGTGGGRPPTTPPARRLVTFGRLALLDADGVEEQSLGTRRRKLALLAYLMLRRRPIPRAVLMEMFWGERDEARARKSLSDALSHLRRVLGPGLVATYASDLAVVPEAAPALDALELERAAQSGDHDRVLALYDGPFLQGMFIPGSTAFEDWSSGARQRFEDLFVAACAAACAAHARDGNPARRAAVAARWLEARPASADAAMHLLDALAEPGTHEARLRALDQYERIRQRLAREYEMEPDPAVQRRAAALARATRDEPTRHEAPSAVGAAATAPIASPPEPAIAPAGDPAPADPAPGDPPPADPAPADAAEPVEVVRGTPRAWYRRVGVAAAALVVVAAGVAGVLWRSPARGMPGPGGPAAPPGRPMVAIVPFSIASGDSASAWLRDALPGVIAAKLAHFDQIEVVPAEQVRGAAADVASGGPSQAGVVASGALTRHDSVYTLDLALHSADGRLLGRQALRDANVMALADLAAVRVLNAADVVATGATLGELETSSLEAYRRYHLAMQAIMTSDPAAVVAQLDAAIALDSGFVVAVLERYRLAVDLIQPDVAARLRQVLRRSRDRMSEGDRLRFDAEDAFYAGDAERSELLVRILVERYPHSVRAHATYINVFLTHGRFAELEAAYARLFALIGEPTSPNARALTCGHLTSRAEARRIGGNLAGAIADQQRAIALCPPGADGWWQLGWLQLSAGKIGEAERSMARGRSLAGRDNSWLRGHLLLRERRWDAVDSLAQRLWRTGTPEARADALDLRSMVLRERARFHEALALDERGRGMGSFFLPHVHVDNLARAGELARLRRFRDEFLPSALGVLSMAGDTLVLRGEGARGWAWHRALYGDAMARLGDTATVRALADSLPVVGQRSYYGRDWRVHHHLRGLLAARAGRHEEAIREFRAALWGPHGWTRTNVELARSLVAVGQPREALAILRGAYGANLDAMGRYATISEIDYHMALAFRALGMPDSAAAYAAYVRRSWAGGDSVVRPLLEALGPER